MSNTRKATGPATPPQPDIAAILSEGGLPEKVVHICLRGHLQAEWDELKAQYEAGPGPDDEALMVERAHKRKIAEEMARVEGEMRAGTVAFRLRALPRRRTPGMPADQVVWHELLEQHPPRKDANGKPNADDARTGFNMRTLREPLVRASVVDPQLTDDQWEQLHGKLTDAQFTLLVFAAINLNLGEIDVPFSRAASITRTFDAELRRQNDSASPSAGLKAGSRGRSRSTTTTKPAA